MILMCCLAPGQMLWRTRSGWWYSGGGVAPTALVWRWQFYNTTSIQHRSFLPFWFAGYPSENKKSQQRAQRGEKQEVDPQLVRGKAPKERKKGKKNRIKTFSLFLFVGSRGIVRSMTGQSQLLASNFFFLYMRRARIYQIRLHQHM